MITCIRCDGRGKEHCTNCINGRVEYEVGIGNCSWCSGTTQRSCYACEGQGEVEEKSLTDLEKLLEKGKRKEVSNYLDATDSDSSIEEIERMCSYWLVTWDDSIGVHNIVIQGDSRLKAEWTQATGFKEGVNLWTSKITREVYERLLKYQRIAERRMT